MSDDRPIFILTCARSGSTLLRVAMNAHPAIGAPPELHLLSLGQRLLWTQGLTLGTDGVDGWEPAVTASRRVLDGIMAAWLERQNKTIWCDKSVTSINHLDILRALYPDARLIVLLRHAADVVASGLTAIADRPDGYDFEPYLAADPIRPQALLSYWLDKTTALAQHAEAGDAVTVRYEDFVREPAATLARLAGDLGLAACPDWEARIYETPVQRGPGDATVYDRGAVQASSLGRGAGLDWSAVSRNLVKRANRLLGQLGYGALDDPESPPTAPAGRSQEESP